MEKLKADRKAVETALSKKLTQICKCVAELKPDYQALRALRSDYIDLYHEFELANSAVLDALMASKDIEDETLPMNRRCIPKLLILSILVISVVLIKS